MAAASRWCQRPKAYPTRPCSISRVTASEAVQKLCVTTLPSATRLGGSPSVIHQKARWSLFRITPVCRPADCAQRPSLSAGPQTSSYVDTTKLDKTLHMEHCRHYASYQTQG